LAPIHVDSLGRGAQCRKRRDHGLLEGDRTAGGSVRQWLWGDYFPPALATPRDKSRGDPDCGPLHRETK